MTDLIDPEAAAAAWAALEQPSNPDPMVPLPGGEFRYYKPLIQAVDDFTRDAQAVERIYTGIPEFDEQMRGVSAGQLLAIVGASHQGKTLMLIHLLHYNSSKRIALFIPDEDGPLVLAKLAAVRTGRSGKELEAAVAGGDREAIAMLRRVATEDFPTLAVFDGPVSPDVMERAWVECELAWGAPPELVCFDYVGLLQHGDDMMGKFDYLKAFGKRHQVPMCVLHQASRTGGGKGQQIDLESGAYGGETHATYMIGVRRKKAALLAERKEICKKAALKDADMARLEEIDYELRIHEFTVTLNLHKNKRVGGGLVDDIDFELEVGTGRLLPLAPGDLPAQYRRMYASPRLRSWSQDSF